METIILVLTVLQGTAISLGMGASTLAILNFFVAIADGKIEGDERKMMGIVYVVLRVAMVLILLTMSLMVLIGTSTGAISLSAFAIAQIIIIAVLFSNAFLMTKRLMPSSIGPALQASSWYTYGTMSTLVGMVGITVTLGMFLLWYCAAIVTALVLVNGAMTYLKKK